MARPRPHDADNTSQRNYIGQSPHTFSAMSHEDLMRSQLQLGAARKAQLQNDLQRLKSKNAMLKQALKEAEKDLNIKDNTINDLLNILRDRPKPSLNSSNDRNSQVVEIDGQEVRVDELINHYNVVIDKHHELLKRRNKEILKLQNNLNRQIPVPKKEMQTQTSQPHLNEHDVQQKLIKQFSTEMGLVRKEYEQVENILTDRNNRLEEAIKKLQNKLDDCGAEISYLKNELLKKENSIQPSEQVVKLLKEKEIENENLKATILKLNEQILNTPREINGNEDVENEIKKLIEDKKDVINKLNDMINDDKKLPESAFAKPDLIDMENECQTILSNLNDVNDKLNKLLPKLKQVSAKIDRPTNRPLVSDLEQIKKQCQDQVDALNNVIAPNSSPTTVIYRIKNVKPTSYPDSSLDELMPRSILPKPISSSSNQEEDFDSTPQISPPPKTLQGQMPKTHPKIHNISSTDSFWCEACGVNLPTAKSKGMLPEFTNRKMDEPQASPETLKKQEPTPKKQEPKKKDKKGCCGKKASETSNVPYYKNEKDKKEKDKTEKDKTEKDKKEKDKNEKDTKEKDKNEKVMQIYDPVQNVAPSRSKSLPPSINRNKIYMNR